MNFNQNIFINETFAPLAKFNLGVHKLDKSKKYEFS